MQITLQQLQAIAKTPTGKQAVIKFLPLLNELLPKFGLTEASVIAAFIAQAMHESAEFTRLTESFNYSTAVRLFNTFPSRFKTIDNAKHYFGKPEAIANFVYANRMGNGNFITGDGFKFRGRGIFQLTGFENYRLVSNVLKLDFIQHPERVAEPYYAVLTACWFWEYRGFSVHARNGAFNTISKLLNGGTNGLEERRGYWFSAKEALGIKK